MSHRKPHSYHTEVLSLKFTSSFEKTSLPGGVHRGVKASFMVSDLSQPTN